MTAEASRSDFVQDMVGIISSVNEVQVHEENIVVQVSMRTTYCTGYQHCCVAVVAAV